MCVCLSLCVSACARVLVRVHVCLRDVASVSVGLYI